MQNDESFSAKHIHPFSENEPNKSAEFIILHSSFVIRLCQPLEPTGLVKTGLHHLSFRVRSRET
ncbi:MAG: hypothetical protein DMF62_03290 [Acidobacteria bacterium]|nr:MAG: hypothetical protein DMF62_03290 [Acidobacteriota bacterium]